MINLRSLGGPVEVQPSSIRDTPHLSFRVSDSILGNIGEPLEHGADDSGEFDGNDYHENEDILNMSSGDEQLS